MLSITETFEKYSNDIYIGLYKILNSSTGSLHNPCYNPPISKMIKEYFANGLWNRIASEGGYDFNKGIDNDYIKKMPSHLLLKDKTVWFLLLASLHYYNKRKNDTASRDLMFLSGYIIFLKYYTSLSNKHMPQYCDKEKAMLALSTLSEKSLFSSKNTTVISHAKTVMNEYGLNAKIKSGLTASNISLGMIYLFDRIKDVYYNDIQSLNDVKNIGALIITMRDRLSQSFKAYARQYYKIINTVVSNDNENEVAIANDVQKAVDTASSGMIYVPDEHYFKIHKLCELPVETLKKIFTIVFNKDNHDITFNCLNIILTEKKNEFYSINNVTEWLLEVRKVIAIRSRYDFRSKIVDLINSEENIKALYDKSSVGYKHKIIQGVGLLLGIALFDTLKQYMLGSINTFYII